ncbi:MAG TPA: hypothetical protein VFZ28_17880 [Burkholderiaceae bacterium]|nr:hypothetical protein [Burkholderiaceae bacterium]
MLPLLLAQWAAVSYACPQPATASQRVAMPDMPDCQGMTPGAAMDPEQPLLCKAHCEHGSQTVNDPPSPVLSPQMLLWAVLDWNQPTVKSAHREEPADDRSAPARPAGSPPLYLLHLVLRN